MDSNGLEKAQYNYAQKTYKNLIGLLCLKIPQKSMAKTC
tara:strand:+ start:1699 stop:1815 length:117 start_codon:yes stop_codon:yes gene_type:complete